MSILNSSWIICTHNCVQSWNQNCFMNKLYYCFSFCLHFLSEWKIRECFGKKIWIQILNYFEPNVMPYPRSKDDERQKGLWKCLGPGSSPPSPWLNTVDDYLFTYLAIFKVPFIVYSNQISLWIMMSVKNWRLFLQAIRY